jgi:hypothetical protein
MTPAVVDEISGFCDAANCKVFEVQVFPVKLVALHILLAARISRHRRSQISTAQGRQYRSASSNVTKWDPRASCSQCRFRLLSAIQILRIVSQTALPSASKVTNYDYRNYT